MQQVWSGTRLAGVYAAGPSDCRRIASRSRATASRTEDTATPRAVTVAASMASVSARAAMGLDTRPGDAITPPGRAVSRRPNRLTHNPGDK